MHNIRLLLNYNLNLYDDSGLVIRCGSSENIPSNPNSKALDKSEELLTVKARIAKLLFRAQETFFLSVLSVCFLLFLGGGHVAFDLFMLI